MSLVSTDFSKEEIFQSSAWYGASTFFMRGIAALNTFVIIYFLTLYEYGVFKLLLSLVGIFQSFVLSGLDGVIRNEIAHHIKDNQEKNAAQLFFEFFLVKGFIAIVIWAFLVVIIKVYFFKLYDSNFIDILLLASFTILLTFLSNSFSLFYRGIGAITLMSKINSGIEVTKLIVLAIVFWWLSPSIKSVIIVIIISQLISHVTYLFFARSDLRLWWRWYGFGSWSLSWQVLKNHGKWSLATNVLSSLLSSGRNYIVKFLISTEAVAIWSMALSMMSFLYSLIPSNKILAIFLPYKIKLGNLKAGYYRSYVKYLTVAYVVLMALGWVGSFVVVNLFFPAYRPSLPIFFIMSLVLIFAGVNDFVSAYLYTLRHQKIIFYRTLQKSILTIVFMFIFVKLFGYIGLGLEYLLTTTCLALFSYISLIRVYPELKLSWRDFRSNRNDWRYVMAKISNLVRKTRNDKLS